MSDLEAPYASEFGSQNKDIPKLKEKDRTTVEYILPETNEVKAERQKDKLPRPTGWRLLLIPFSQPRTSSGGIHFTDKTKENEEIATVTCQVVALGPLAYKDDYKFNGVPWCKEGDYVIIARYAGSRVKLFGEKADRSDDLACRILNDDEILAVIDDPADYVGLS